MAFKYWVGGSQTWDENAGNKWSFNPGGAPGAPVPNSTDDVFFNAQSGSSQVFVSGTTPICSILNLSGFLGQLRRTSSGANDQITVRSITFDAQSGAAFGGLPWAADLLGPKIKIGVPGGVITTLGKPLSEILFEGAGGLATTLNSDLNCYSITITYGKLDLNNFNITTRKFTASKDTPQPVEIYLRSGTISLTGDGWFAYGGFDVFDAGTSTIAFINKTSGVSTFQGGGLTYYNLVHSQLNTQLLIGAFDSPNPPKNNTFNSISNTVQPVRFSFYGNSTQTVSNFNVSGTPGNLVILDDNSFTSGFSLSKASGTVECYYLNLSYSNAIGGATWNAYNSVNNIGNSGWNFLSAPISLELVGVVTTGLTGEVGLITGVESVGTIGSVAIEKYAAISSTVSTGEIGVLTAITGFIGELSGVATTANVSSLGVTHDGLQLSQVFNVGQIGSVVATVVEETVPVGVQASSQAGSLLYTTSRAVSNTSATGEVGEFGVFNGIIVAVSGVQTNGAVGSFSIPWYPMSTAQTANWGNIGTAQTASWTNIN